MLRFGQTRRYHTEVLVKDQDVAQHSFNVAWLCWYLSDREPSAELLMAALSHDAGEQATGDMPAPVKLHLGISGAMDILEANHTRSLGFRAPTLSQVEQDILKLSDRIEGALYCIRELKMGNLMILPVAYNFAEYIEPVLNRIQSPSVQKKGLQLLSFIVEQIDAYHPRTKLGTLLFPR